MYWFDIVFGFGFGVWLIGIQLEFAVLCLCGLDLFCFGLCGVRLLLGERLDVCVIWLCFRCYCLMVHRFDCVWAFEFWLVAAGLVCLVKLGWRL